MTTNESAITVRLTRGGGVATLTLDRPQALNTLDLPMMRELVQQMTVLAHDGGLRCLVLRGAGRNFMAGGDLRTFAREMHRPAAQRTAWFARMVRELNAAIELVDRLPCPVVAGVQGAVAGFGLSLMLACDLVVAADDASFSSAYRHVGLTPDGGLTWTLPRAVGLARAMEIVLLGDRFDAATAKDLGLVNTVVPLAELDGALAKLVARLVSGPAQALARSRRLLRQSHGRSLTAQLEAEAEAFGGCAGSDDFAEGLDAFLGKRAPRFGGG